MNLYITIAFSLPDSSGINSLPSLEIYQSACICAPLYPILTSEEQKMSATIASQPAHQLREDSAELEVKQKSANTSNLSGPVQAELSYSAPPEDGSTVSAKFEHAFLDRKTDIPYHSRTTGREQMLIIHRTASRAILASTRIP